jgi:hypothetical protein|nr:MAG TPA: helix-turn-helix domain protein [Caudoviricetes sp.]
MNYLAEILAFYDLVQVKQLSTGQIALWHALMAINNRCTWIEWFTVPNLTLELNTGMSRSGVLKARNALKQYGLIDFKVNGTKATNYKMITIAKSKQESNQIGKQVSTQDGKQVGKQVRNTLNKRKETKLKKESKKKAYGEYQHVLFSDEEYEKLKAYFPNDYEKRIQSLDEYIQKSGKKYKDFLLTLKTWARRDGYVPPNEKEKNKDKFKSVDLSCLTNEEYGLLMQKKITIEELIKKGRVHVE